MKKLIVLLVALLLAAGTAAADVSNEVIVGLEVDSIDKAKDSAGADITDKVENDNSLFTVQYTRFFSPLKDDGKPIELRRFYQHPSTLSVELAFIGFTDKDSTVPAAVSDGKGSASMLLLGGEFFLPTNTGFFLNIGAGSGEFEETVGGFSQPDVAIKFRMLDLGVRQYIGQSAEIHLRIESESTESSAPGTPVFAPWTETVDRSVTYLGARGVIADVVGLALELGGGELEEKAGGLTIKSDISAVNVEIAGYFGKQFSARLSIASEEEDVQGMAAGISHTTTTTRTTLGFRYWFSESFGMELPIYSEKEENKVSAPFGGGTSETTNAGLGLYAAFRF